MKEKIKLKIRRIIGAILTISGIFYLIVWWFTLDNAIHNLNSADLPWDYGLTISLIVIIIGLYTLSGHSFNLSDD
jgi:hypothetical protein